MAQYRVERRLMVSRIDPTQRWRKMRMTKKNADYIHDAMPTDFGNILNRQHVPSKIGDTFQIVTRPDLPY